MNNRTNRVSAILFLGFVVGVGAFHGITWVTNTIHDWRVTRLERYAATRLVQALDSGTLLCTNEPLSIQHHMIDSTILIIPKHPMQQVIKIEDGNNLVISGVNIQGLSANVFMNISHDTDSNPQESTEEHRVRYPALKDGACNYQGKASCPFPGATK